MNWDLVTHVREEAFGSKIVHKGGGGEDWLTNVVSSFHRGRGADREFSRKCGHKFVSGEGVLVISQGLNE